MRKQIQSDPLASGLLLFGGVGSVAAVVGAFELHRSGQWLGAYLFLAIIGGVSIGSIGLGLFRYTVT